VAGTMTITSESSPRSRPRTWEATRQTSFIAAASAYAGHEVDEHQKRYQAQPPGANHEDRSYPLRHCPVQAFDPAFPFTSARVGEFAPDRHGVSLLCELP
jgi:hypothetical protein